MSIDQQSRQWWMDQGAKKERERILRKLRKIQKAEIPRIREFMRHVIDILFGKQRRAR